MSEKLKALKAELVIRQRQYNMAERALARVKDDIAYLEQRYELARTGPKAKRVGRKRSESAAG